MKISSWISACVTGPSGADGAKSGSSKRKTVTGPQSRRSSGSNVLSKLVSWNSGDKDAGSSQHSSVPGASEQKHFDDLMRDTMEYFNRRLPDGGTQGPNAQPGGRTEGTQSPRQEPPRAAGDWGRQLSDALSRTKVREAALDSAAKAVDVIPEFSAPADGSEGGLPSASLYMPRPVLEPGAAEAPLLIEQRNIDPRPVRAWLAEHEIETVHNSASGLNCVLISLLQHATGHYDRASEPGLAQEAEECRALLKTRHSEIAALDETPGQDRMLYPDEPAIKTALAWINERCGANLDVHWVEPHADGYPVRVQCSSTGREPVAIIRFQDHYEALRSVSAAVYGRTGHGRSEEQLSPLRENEGCGMPFLRGRHEKQVAPAHTVREQSGPAVPVGVREPSGMAKAQEPPSAAPTRRQTLLETYHAARQRQLDLERALAAVKLRRAAEVYCEKNEWARFTPRLPRMPVARQRFEALAALSADELIANVEAHPERYSRTLLTDVAQHHLLAALNIDVKLYEQGIHQAGLYEGLHSVAGRIVTAAASAVSLGVAEIPGAGHALKAGKKAIKVMAHELPPNIVNPALTGRLRSVTDVKEAFKRVGGQPVVAPQIEKSPNMGVIVQRLKDKRRKLNDAAKQFAGVSAAPGRDSNALGNLVDAFLDLHDTADHQYRRRIGLNRTQTYSKGWGMAINGVAATGAILTPTVPVVGQIVGPAILASTIPLQWVAGYLDERRNKHRYNFRANTKWANFLHENVAHIHFKDLKPEHISERALRQSFITQSEVQVAAIREVYEDTLGEWMHRRVELERKIGVMESTGMATRAIWPHRAHLRGLGLEMDLAKEQVEHFESFDAGRWSEIPADSLIGRCLDDLKQLEQANRAARLRKPGESAQIVQRYVQAFHAGVSTGTALPVIDAITLTDSLYARDAHGHQTALHPGAEAGAVGTGIVGGGVFTATTGEVRMSKADNKKLISELRVSPEQFRADERQWVFKAGDRTVDLRNSAGYRRHVHSTWDEFRLIGRAVRSGLFSGPAGLWHLSRAKGWPWGELRRAKAELRAALDLLAASDTPKPVAHDVARADTLSAMKDELYDYPAVRIHLGTKGLCSDG